MDFNNPTENVRITKPHVTFENIGGGDAGTKLSVLNTGASNKNSNLTTVLSTAPIASSLPFQFGITRATTAVTTNTSILKPVAPAVNLSTAAKLSTDANKNNQMKYHHLEDTINKWTLQLEDEEQVLINQASQISAWDNLIINNNKRIIELNDDVQKLKTEHQTLENGLEFISSQQTELEKRIAPLQKELMKMPQDDLERTQVYLLVRNLEAQFKQMSEDLKEIIDNLNESVENQANPGPIDKIGKILNVHMDSIKWIENSVETIGNKLDAKT